MFIEWRLTTTQNGLLDDPFWPACHHSYLILNWHCCSISVYTCNNRIDQPHVVLSHLFHLQNEFEVNINLIRIIIHVLVYEERQRVGLFLLGLYQYEISEMYSFDESQ